MLLKDKVCVVTGGAGLLGSKISTAVSSSGGTVVIADIDEAAASRITSDIGGQACYYPLDITSQESIISLLNYLESKFGRVDCLVNNAYPRNKNYGRKFEDVEYSDFCENVNLNLGGYFLMCQQFCKYFSKNNGGIILNIGSIYGVIAPKFEIYKGTELTMPVEYSVVKSGLIHMTKYIAKYYKGKNIRINCVCPGGLFNNQPSNFIFEYNKLGLNKGMLDAQDISGACVFLLSDMASYINGQTLIVDDGVCL